MIFLQIIESKNENMRLPSIRTRILKEATEELNGLGYMYNYKTVNRKFRNLLIYYRRAKGSEKEKAKWPFYKVSL